MSLCVIIIEDEAITSRNLQYLLENMEADIEVVQTLENVTEAVEYIKEFGNNCDLFFMDIQLGDGVSFDIFKQVKIEVPVIFVTAYNEYALEAFKANGIDYILKPFQKEDVEAAISKFNLLKNGKNDAVELNILAKVMESITLKTVYKKAFLVHVKDRMVPLNVNDICYFFTENELVRAITKTNQVYPINNTLESLEQQLDPHTFYRANRQFIINRDAVTEVNFYFNGRLHLKTLPPSTEKILVSKARATHFKNWMDS